MIKPNILSSPTCLIIVFCWLYLVNSSAWALSPCQELDLKLASSSEKLEQLKNQLDHLNQLKSGQLKPQFNLLQMITTNLINPKQVKAAINALDKKITAFSEMESGWADCANSKRYQQQLSEIKSIQEALRTEKLKLLRQPRKARVALVRESNQWQRLYQLQLNLEQWQAEQEPNPAATQLKDEILQWIEQWRTSAQLWLSHILFSNAPSKNEVTWLNAVAIPTPDSVIQWQDPDLSNIDNFTQLQRSWRRELISASNILSRATQRWHNQEVWQQGWLAFFRAISKPSTFWPQLLGEVESAPFTLVNFVTSPLVQDYRSAVTENRKGELISSWFLQGLALAALLSTLLNLAAKAPSSIARLQQKLYQWVDHRILMQISSAVLWFIKPNAPWILVLVSTQLIVLALPQGWLIVKALAPLGVLYSAYRALRVILEWALSRSFTRSGQFVSSQTAQTQTKDVHLVAWILMAYGLFWALGWGTGGGYSLYLITIIVLVASWFTILWLLLRYRDSSARFLLYCVGKSNIDQQQRQAVQKWWLTLFWPGLYALGHLSDLVVHFHQKLLTLDGYRSLSVKLLRMRIAAESREDEKSAEQDTPPDENYSDWMLRNSNEATIEFDRQDIIFNSLTQWKKDQSSDNILLITGDQGSGKTTLIELIRSRWQDTEVTTLEVPAKTTTPAAVHKLIAQHFGNTAEESVGALVAQEDQLQPQVVIVENAHNLFLSEVGHLDGFRSFNQYLNARLTKVFWVVVMYSASWNFLSRVYERELHFSNIYQLSRWSPANIRKLILSRHQGSRRRIRYDELLLSASAGNESSSVRAADSRVFNILWEQCGGNPLVALHLWVAACRSKGWIVEIAVPEKPSSTPLKTLKDDPCFIFAAIIIHESLNSDEIGKVTHYPETIVRHALKLGMKMGLLQRDEQRRYRIHPLWQGTLSSFLYSKNMILNQ